MLIEKSTLVTFNRHKSFEKNFIRDLKKNKSFDILAKLEMI